MADTRRPGAQIAAPWSAQAVGFDAGQRRLTIHVDLGPGGRLAHPNGEHKVHDTQVQARLIADEQRGRRRGLAFEQPGSFFGLSVDCRVCPQDVDRDSAYDGKICGPQSLRERASSSLKTTSGGQYS
jgi:hypothetical protein